MFIVVDVREGQIQGVYQYPIEKKAQAVDKYFEINTYYQGKGEDTLNYYAEIYGLNAQDEPRMYGFTPSEG